MEFKHAETSQQLQHFKNERATPTDLNKVRGADRPQLGSRQEHSQRDRSRKRIESISKQKDLGLGDISVNDTNAKHNDEGSISTRAKQNDESDNESKRSHSRRSSFSLSQG